MRTRLLLSLPVVLTLATAATASAQEAPPTPAPAATPAAPADAQDTSKELLKVSPNGLTSEQVGQRAAQTSNVAKANDEALKAAAARVDQAWAAFLPRVSGVARYTRLSDFQPPSFGSGSLVGTLAPAGTLNPSPTAAVALSFPLVLDNWLLQATLQVPISDYFLRINQNYTAAVGSQTAARYDAATARAKAAADGRSAYYGWLRARAGVVVATEALQDLVTKANDVKNQFTVGNVSKVDVLRAETGVANGELQVVVAKNILELSEKQLKVAMHASEDETWTPGESLDAPLQPFSGNLRDLVKEAESSRLELKSIAAVAESVRASASVARAGAFPRLDGVADAVYANPNQRRFPQTNEWFPTWDIGVQLSWAPNDVLTSLASGRTVEAQAAQLEAQKLTLRDGIEIDVTQAYQSAVEADQALSTSTRELAAATEAYRVARELFNAGRATGVVLTDALNDLTRARYNELNAKTAGRLSRVRLEHALGRDTKGVATP